VHNIYEWTDYESNGDDFQPLKKVKTKGESSRWFPEPYNYQHPQCDCYPGSVCPGNQRRLVSTDKWLFLLTIEWKVVASTIHLLVLYSSRVCTMTTVNQLTVLTKNKVQFWGFQLLHSDAEMIMKDERRYCGCEESYEISSPSSSSGSVFMSRKIFW